MPAALQRTPCGAAELGCARATDSADVTALAAARPAPLEALLRAMVVEVSALAREDMDTGPGRHRAGRVLAAAAGEVLRTSHNGLLHVARPVAALKLRLVATLHATPVMSCAHFALRARPALTRCSARRALAVIGQCGIGCAETAGSSGQALRAVRGVGPAHPVGLALGSARAAPVGGPSAPQGGSLHPDAVGVPFWDAAVVRHGSNSQTVCTALRAVRNIQRLRREGWCYTFSSCLRMFCEGYRPIRRTNASEPALKSGCPCAGAHRPAWVSERLRA